jgi:kynureninase
MTERPAVVGASEADALARDRDDPGWRELFAVPPWPGGREPRYAYLAGNSLGLMPHAARDAVLEELDDWASLAVEGHLTARRPWLPYHELLREPAARLVGAEPEEVVAMNSLTVNLHLMLTSFYRPYGKRCRIVIEDAAFPSDGYAVASQAALHGLDPAEAVLRLVPREGEDVLRTEDVVETLEREAETIAVVLLGAVGYRTGEWLDLRAITAAGRAAGALVGWDLAHAAGNVPLALHDAGVDFAAWCTYKYLNSGPGAVAGAFVHARHANDPTLPRLAGWWGNDPATRFRMEREFAPRAGADGWQLSNPPILALAPVLASLRIFDRTGMPALRARSLRLTGYLEELLDELSATRPLRVLTPRDPSRRGCQLSVLVPQDADELSARLRDEHGVIADARRPNVIRLAPVPLYSTFHDCWRAADALGALIGTSS